MPATGLAARISTLVACGRQSTMSSPTLIEAFLRARLAMVTSVANRDRAIAELTTAVQTLAALEPSRMRSMP
jgi:hypothetical protein